MAYRMVAILMSLSGRPTSDSLDFSRVTTCKLTSGFKYFEVQFDQRYNPR